MPYTTLGDIQTLLMANNAQSDNQCCILTLDCTVNIMGNIYLEKYVQDDVIATLPQSMRPIQDIFIPVLLDNQIVTMHVNLSGEISINSSTPSGTLYMNGVFFNVCGTYYNDEIGNNFSQGTSPLRGDEF